jgi:hypothetical protein
MCLIFPHLKHLTLNALYTKSLALFLDSLQNLTELYEITIHQLSNDSDNSNEHQTLLYQVLSANNSRLTSVKFDWYSNPFSVEMQTNGVLFTNIDELHINLKTINDLHQLLTILPTLCYLYTQVHEEYFDLDEQNEYIIISSLKYFHLRSFCHSWTLDELASIIKRIPNVKELSIEIEGDDDIRLIDGQEFFSLLSDLSLKKFNYFLKYFNTSYFIDQTKILSTWHQFKQEFVCIKSDDNKIVALYSLPFVFSYLILPCSLAKNKVFIESYTTQAKDLTLCRVSTQIVDIFPIINKCHRTHIIDLRIDEKVEPRKISSFILSNMSSFYF